MKLISPVWPTPVPRIAACTTLRGPAAPSDPYAAFNLGLHVGDDAARVARHRAALTDHVGRPLQWLDQVHGTDVIRQFTAETPTADAAISTTSDYACAVMTADCLPVLLCDRDGTCVGAAHAGWRGLANGIIERMVDALPASPDRLMAWLGPAISQAHFEVGPEVRETFVADLSGAETAFIPSRQAGRYMADIYQLARLRLARLGITAVSGGEYCTVRDAHLFYSYRRDAGVTGRMASVIWLQP